MTTAAAGPVPLPEGAAGRPVLDAVLGLTLTDEQWDAVSARLDPAVIVAGAGSGKTTSMAARVAWLVGRGLVRPDAVLGLTFTTKAAAQLQASMRASVAALVDRGVVAPVTDEGAPLGEPQVLTYHAFAARILTEHGIRIGREPTSTMFSEGARQQLAHRVVCRTTAPLATLGRSPLQLTGDLLSLDDELTELGVQPAALREFDDDLAATLRTYDSLQRIGVDLLATSSARAVLADLVEEWRAEKSRRDLLDFADQIRLAGDLVQRFPDVVADLRSRFGAVLLDEYQDTSIAQRVLLQRIFGAGHPVMAVGDPCQAIYGWRGASVDNIESFPLHFPVVAADDRSTARFSLSQNRRSGPAILEIANRASEHLRGVHAGVQPLSAGDNGKGSGQVVCALFETYAQEVDWVVDQVEATHNVRGVPSPVSWKDIAVLTATGADLVAIATALRHRGVPTQLVGAQALLAQPAVIDLRSMLELVHDPSANAAFVRIAAGPRWRIGARDLAALGQRAADLAGGRHRSGQEDIGAALDDAVAGTDLVESVSLTEALEDLGEPDAYSPQARDRFEALGRELRQLRLQAGEPLADFVLRVMRTSGLEVEAALGPPAQAAQQQHALQAFVDLAAEFTDLDGRPTLGAFLRRLRDAERFDVDLELGVSGPADAVQLLTVHKAKGLEFPYVFVPFLADGAFPGGRGRAQWPTSVSTVPWALRDDCTPDLASFPIEGESPRAKHYDAYKAVLRDLTDLENQRLAYVAFTRAERGLAVSGHWWGPTQSTRRGPHPFLVDVHRACLDGFGSVAYWAPEPAEDAANPQATAAAAPCPWPAPLDADRRARLLAAADAVRSVAAVQDALPGIAGADGLTAAEQARVAEWDVLADALLEEARVRHQVDRTVHLPESVSASLLMRAVAEPEVVALELARPMPRPPAPAAQRGTAFHAWVEARYGQQSLLDPDDLPGAADEDIASDEQLHALKEAFESGPFAHREPVAVEAPFALVIGGRVVNGRIDAVFASPDDAFEFEVVDWKTGSATHVDPMQLAIYRMAWAQVRGVPVDAVSAAFVIVATGEVLRPDTSAAVELFSRL